MTYTDNSEVIRNLEVQCDKLMADNCDLRNEVAELSMERDALRAENERMREIMRGCEVPAIAQETGQYGEWLTHDSHEPPAPTPENGFDDS